MILPIKMFFFILFVEYIYRLYDVKNQTESLAFLSGFVFRSYLRWSELLFQQKKKTKEATCVFNDVFVK